MKPIDIVDLVIVWIILTVKEKISHEELKRAVVLENENDYRAEYAGCPPKTTNLSKEIDKSVYSPRMKSLFQ